MQRIHRGFDRRDRPQIWRESASPERRHVFVGRDLVVTCVALPGSVKHRGLRIAISIRHP